MVEKTIFDKINESFKAHSSIDGRYIIIYANETNNIWNYNDFRRNLLAIQNEIENKYLRFFNFNFLGDNFLIDTPVVANLEFENCDFEYITKYKTNNNKYAFINCRIYSLYLVGEVDFTLTFQDCKIEKAEIRNCNITSKISFKNSIIENDLQIINNKINQADFSNVKFKNNTYFNNTEFSDYADFHEAEFEAVACFYGVTFKEPMNFSSVIFKDFNKTDFVNLNIENINLENIKTAVEKNYKDKSYNKEVCDKTKEYEQKIKTNLGEYRQNKQKIKTQYKKEKEAIKAQYDKEVCDKFKEYKQKIETNLKEYKQNKQIIETQYKKEKEIINLKYKIRWANNFRDSFRVIKHSLIETDNNLEASNLHKLELYAKEIGLEYGTEIKDDKKTIIGRIKNKKSIKSLIDFNLLSIYRNTSEHHTDFARILNFTITMIALFGFIVYLQKISIGYNLFIAISAFFLYFIFDIFSYKGDSYKNTIYDIFSKLFFISPIVLFILAKIFADENIFNDYANTIIFSISYLFYLYLIIYGYEFEKFRTTLSFISYPIFFIMLFAFTSLIIPYANLNSNSQNQFLQTKLSSATQSEIINLASVINKEFNATKNPNSSENLSISELNEYKKFIVENKDDLYKKLDDNDKFNQAIYADSSRDKTIKCISFIYAIILGLCLFSLQKTARRNSVVPS